MSKKYTIAELEWSGPDHESNGDFLIRAPTPFGAYTIEQYGDKITWSYRFDEFYDEGGMFECDSLEDGKAKAWRHWNERLTPALNPV